MVTSACVLHALSLHARSRASRFVHPAPSYTAMRVLKFAVPQVLMVRLPAACDGWLYQMSLVMVLKPFWLQSAWAMPSVAAPTVLNAVAPRAMPARFAESSLAGG